MELGIIRGIIYSRRYENDWRGKHAHINIILLVKFDGFQVSSVNSVTPANLSHVYLKGFEIRDEYSTGGIHIRRIFTLPLSQCGRTKQQKNMGVGAGKMDRGRGIFLNVVAHCHCEIRVTFYLLLM